MKKVISIILITVIILAFMGCSSSPTNIKSEYNKAIIKFPDGSVVEVEIENWMPNGYNDGLVIISKDGTKYRVNSVNCILIKE